MSKDLRFAVIGAGPAGIAAGRELLAQGFSNFRIFEKSDEIGGTWHLNTYPGLACDVKAHAYTFSYRPNPDWSASFVNQPEIKAYLQTCASEFGLDPYIEVNAEIASARYQGTGEWLLTTRSGEAHTFDVVINAMGNQHTNIFPDVPGIDSFRGDWWHSMKWNDDVDLTGKRVVVVGSAAASIQLVPEVAKQAGTLKVLQRTPNWILPRGAKPYSATSRSLMRTFPFLARGVRAFHEKIMNLSTGATQLGHKTQERVEDMVRKHIDQAVKDPVLKELVTPKGHFGCKRPLVSDFWYPALQRDNVELVASALKEVTPSGVLTQDGRRFDADVIVYATGYKVMDFERIDVVGLEGATLGETLGRAPEAFKSIAAPGFPNYFFTFGPNGATAAASYFTAIEANIRAILKVVREKEAAGAKAVQPREDLTSDYNDWILQEREKFAWGVAACDSYYRTASGHTPFLFPGDVKTFMQQREEVGLHEFEVVA